MLALSLKGKREERCGVIVNYLWYYFYVFSRRKMSNK
jgi:hypothetical protein